ncbi:hypothetical protein KAR91_19815 [Candidatus Pacearchaeota archaeon]|nr:hypothetical protein [Candidatus Pacearchaeota archaeon]
MNCIIRIVEIYDWPKSIFYFASMILMVVTPVNANSNNNEIDLSGLVIDRTITLKGRQFYLAFSSSWSPSKKIDSYNIIIKEKPSARWGSKITIENQGKILYSTLLQRNGSELKKQVQIATQSVNKQLFSLYLFNNQGSDDISANGY